MTSAQENTERDERDERELLLMASPARARV